jgi:hypothetical protein
MAPKPVRSRFKRASADKCLRTAGARVAIASSDVKKGNQVDFEAHYGMKVYERPNEKSG